MSTVLAAGILFAIASCAALIQDQRIEEQFPLAAGIVVGTLYVFALAGLLNIGFAAVVTLGATAAAGMTMLLIRRKNVRLLLTPGRQHMRWWCCGCWFLSADTCLRYGMTFPIGGWHSKT